MNAKFFDLKKEKQDRMINAILKVFAANGYEHASTDEIVREAGISKGLLFHYFGSKLGAYTFACDYSVKYMTLEFKATVSETETDLFEVLKQIECARMHAMRGYPHMQLFLNRSLNEDVGEALFAVEESRNAIMDLYDTACSGINYEAFGSNEEGIRLRRVLELFLKGLMEERFREGSFQPEMFYQEAVGYLDMMRRITMPGNHHLAAL